MFDELPESLRQTVQSIPGEPGVYVFRDSFGQPLYVGKSRRLCDRVRTYFRTSVPDRKTAHLRALTRSIDLLVLDSDFQAREVEADLIRAFRPEYNTVYLDYMHRPLIRIAQTEDYPRVEVVSEKQDDDARYFGPYRSTRRLRRILDILGSCFEFRTCDLDIPAGGAPERFETCHQYALGRCRAPCVGKESPEAYRNRLDELVAFLEGNFQSVLGELEEQMNEHASNHRYEAAELYRKKHDAIQQLVEYEPFIRRTLEADLVHRDSQTMRWAHLAVRDHRVTGWSVYDNDALDRLRSQLVVERPIVMEQPGNWAGEGSARSPRTGEEQTLLKAVKRSLKWYRKRDEGNGDGLVDRVHLEEGTWERFHEGQGQPRRSESGVVNGHPEEELVRFYGWEIEQGRPVPDRLETAGSGPTLDRQVIIRRARSNPGEPSGKAESISATSDG